MVKEIVLHFNLIINIDFWVFRSCASDSESEKEAYAERNLRKKAYSKKRSLQQCFEQTFDSDVYATVGWVTLLKRGRRERKAEK